MRVIDSHTEGEPTRVVIEGGPDLGTGSLQERLRIFAEHHDNVRRAIILEPRGSDAMVGALLCEPIDSTCVSGVIFFNNSGYLGMCGHGAMGVAVTLSHLGRIGPGIHRLETPVGVVQFELRGQHEVSIQNVPSYRFLRQANVRTQRFGIVTGDVAWGGNWFFLVNEIAWADGRRVAIEFENVRELTEAAAEVRRALEAQYVTGEHNAEIDHIEIFGPAKSSDAHSRNFVYCPGGAYDRSPCGTGTSAKIACLAADGKLAIGEQWIQESIIGSRFIASYQPDHSPQATDGAHATVIPTITGRAFICSEATLIQQDNDPFACGIQ